MKKFLSEQNLIGIESIPTTLKNWLSANSLETQFLSVRSSTDQRLQSAYCSFRGECFDKLRDAKKLELDYMFELERRDPRFKNTALRFISNVELKIMPWERDTESKLNILASLN